MIFQDYTALAMLVLLAIMVYALLQFLKTSGKPIQDYLKPIETVITAAEPIVAGLDINPNGSTPMDKLMHWLHIGVSAAEQVFQAGNLPSEGRMAFATDFVHKMADHIGIEWTPELQHLVEIALEGSVFFLPTTTPPAPVVDPASVSTTPTE